MSPSLRDQLTMIIPTRNRYDRLKRLLTYLRAHACTARLMILDSSSSAPPGGDELEQLLMECGAAIRLTYDADQPPLEKMLDGLARVHTPYVVLCADDDFLIPSALKAAVDVLVARPEVSLVHGQSCMLHVVDGAIQWVDPYPQCHLLQSTAAERLQAHFRRYTVTFYSMHRIEALRRNFELVCGAKLDWHTWGELALSALAVIQGKALALPQLYMIREGHAGMNSAAIVRERGLDPFDCLVESSFTREHGSYEIFRDCLVPELIRHDGLQAAQARTVIKYAFWPYLMSQMEERRMQRNGECPRLLTSLRQAARRVPGLRTAWRTVRFGWPGQVRTISLYNLLQAASPYHKDFMGVYRVVLERLSDSATVLTPVQ